MKNLALFFLIVMFLAGCGNEEDGALIPSNSNPSFNSYHKALIAEGFFGLN